MLNIELEEREEEREEKRVVNLQTANTWEPKKLIRETSEPDIKNEELTIIQVG
jgi:hypothetical protein